MYCIENVQTGKYYVGSSQDLRKRRNRHWCELRRGTHINYNLQTAFYVDGENAFRFVLLEASSPKDLQEVEQRWLDSAEHARLYNIFRTAYAVRGPDHPMFGHTHTAEASEKIRQARARQIVAHSPETRAKIGKGNRGKKVDPAHIAKMVAARVGLPVWNKGQTVADNPTLENKYRTKVPPAIVRKLVCAYLSGESISALSRTFELTWAVVRRALVDNGVPLRSLRQQKILYEFRRRKVS